MLFHKLVLKAKVYFSKLNNCRNFVFVLVSLQYATLQRIVCVYFLKSAGKPSLRRVYNAISSTADTEIYFLKTGRNYVNLSSTRSMFLCYLAYFTKTANCPHGCLEEENEIMGGPDVFVNLFLLFLFA